MEQDMLQRLYEQHSVGVYRFALSILHDPQDAEDVTQETFLRAMKNGSYRFEPGKERAFLCKIARNTAYNLLRKRRREVPQAMEAAVWYPEDLEYLHLLSCLSDRDRDIVSLKILAGATHAETAKVLGITVHAAKKRYERAIAKIRTAYEEGTL